MSTTFKIPKTQKAIVIDELDKTGNDYSVLKYQDVPIPEINDDEILIKNKYTGVNFIEKYFRTGLYPTSKPCILGREATGVVVKTGANVKDYEVGNYVAYASSGTFAQYTKFKPAIRILKLPKDVTDEKLQFYGGLFVQAFTALSFVTEAYHVKPGDYILVHAAAGGVGSLLTQLIRERGAHVIATASTNEKLQLAKSLGAEHLINSRIEDTVARVMEITKGQGVQASFDGVGKDTYEISYNSLARKGTLVSYGNSSGPVPPINISTLTARNLKILRPTVFNYLATKDEWEYYSTTLLKLIEENKLKLSITKVYKLEDYHLAARDLESRNTSGKLLLRIE